MKIGIEYDILSPAQDISPEVGIINIINPLIPDFLEDNELRSLPQVQTTGKEVVVDGAFIDLNTGTPERAVRRVVQKKVNESIEFAERYDAVEIIFLSNFLPFLNEKLYYESWFYTNAIGFWKEMSAAHPDMRISIANVYEFTPEPLLRIVGEVGSPNLGIAFDLGHALLFSKIDLYLWYQQIKPYLSTLYAHSNDRTGDLHLHLCEGEFLDDTGVAKIFREITGERVLLKSFEKNNYGRDIGILKGLRG